MPGRKFSSASEYRYGFNGQENSDEIAAGLTTAMYWEYDSRIGRRWNRDPVFKVWESPYACFGNNPIAFIDPLGLTQEDPKPKVQTLEPVIVTSYRHGKKKPLTESQKNAQGIIFGIYGGAGYHFMKENNIYKLMLNGASPDIKGIYNCGGNGNGYKTDTRLDNAGRFNMFVSNSTMFDVDESESNKFDDYEAFVVYKLLDNFVYGTGPENYNFPKNGVISSKFLNSDILNAAITDFNSGKRVQNKQYSFGFSELAKDTKRNGTLFNITGLVGSGTITITPTAKGIEVQIFNITSLTSGDISKNPFNDKNWPKSIVRNPVSVNYTKFSNISQTFNLFIPYKK